MKENFKARELAWRRDKVISLTSRGYSQAKIAKILQVSEPTVFRDLEYITEQANQNIQQWIDKKLVIEHHKVLVGLYEILAESWAIEEKSEDDRTKLQALSLARETEINIQDTITNANVLGEAMKFVNETAKDRLLQQQQSAKKLTSEDNNTTTTAETVNQVF